jgi:macrolide-specific efflux system membrane fusion protein
LNAINRTTVKVILEDGKVEQREVKIGTRNRVMAQIVSGLQPGERVATSERAPQGARAASAARTPKMGPRL